jgi:hypothetical protein
VINYPYIFWALAIGCLIGYGFGRYRVRSFQNHGESRVSRAIRANFVSPDYHLLNHITLKLADGTTQIDHILVSRFGVFVIETKAYKGWIFANPGHAQWTQVLFTGKFKFQNPIAQNRLHLQVVKELLDFLPPSAIKSVVVFAGNAEFKTDRPSGVFTVSELVHHLRGCKEEILSINRVQFCVGRLETARLAVTGQTDLEHVDYLRRRHGLRN